jgi:hypothetical protein
MAVLILTWNTKEIWKAKKAKEVLVVNQTKRKEGDKR